jgi:hypothetical protein
VEGEAGLWRPGAPRVVRRRSLQLTAPPRAAARCPVGEVEGEAGGLERRARCAAARCPVGEVEGEALAAAGGLERHHQRPEHEDGGVGSGWRLASLMRPCPCPFGLRLALRGQIGPENGPFKLLGRWPTGPGAQPSSILLLPREHGDFSAALSALLHERRPKNCRVLVGLAGEDLGRPPQLAL